MGKTGSDKRKREYDEMERGGLSASFRRPPWYMTAAGMEKKEGKDGIRKKEDGRTGAKKLGAG